MKKPQGVLAVSIALACGVGIGYWGGHYQHAPPLPEESSQMAALRSTIQALQTENQRLKVTRVAASDNPLATVEPKRAAPASLTHMDELTALAHLQQRKLVNPVISILNREGRLDQGFIGLFALTPSEQDQLQSEIDRVRQNLANLERANAKLTRDERGNIVVAVQPFPAEGGKVYDEMMQAMADVLGRERNDVFRKIGVDQLEKSLGRFGAAERTYVFGYDVTERPGQPPYTFEDKVVQRQMQGGSSSSTSRTRFRSFEDLTKSVGPIVSILPPDYRQGK